MSPKVYEIGDKVLVYDAVKYTSHTDKLDLKWKVPYYIHNIVNPEAYKLQIINRQILQIPINKSLFKLCYMGATNIY